jgi:UDP-2,3-diacylglucosamine hydrolase
MPSRILLISDLHLEESRPDITASLLRFLEDNRDRCDALYVLGDLFEVWIGDDESSELTQTVSAAFKDFSQTTQLFFMHGNRDFLL